MDKRKAIGAGYAWSDLEPKVDNLVEDLMKKENLPGMTVAVTKNGRLILTKGDGREFLLTAVRDSKVK